jgi:pimeloyl-ACP methyl ester carboxylesterase
MADDLIRQGWRSHHLTANSLRFHVVEAGPADGPPLIMLHGFPEFWWAWRKQIQPLVDAGFRVVVPDMRGYNLSDAPQGLSAYGLDMLASDVVALADALAIQRFDLVGHDWGGVVAWWVAARHADRMRRLVILDAPHPDIWATEALRHPTQALKSSYAMFFQLPWLPEAAFGAFDFAALRTMTQGSARPEAFEPGALDRYVEAWQRPGRFTAMLNYYRALRQPRSAAPARITPPTLIVWGEKDTFLERHVADASLAQCDDGCLKILADTTHWLHLEQPEVVTSLIRSHLEART